MQGLSLALFAHHHPFIVHSRDSRYRTALNSEQANLALSYGGAKSSNSAKRVISNTCWRPLVLHLSFRTYINTYFSIFGCNFFSNGTMFFNRIKIKFAEKSFGLMEKIRQWRRAIRPRSNFWWVFPSRNIRFPREILREGEYLLVSRCPAKISKSDILRQITLSRAKFLWN